MIKWAKSYTKSYKRETKNYQTQIYNVLWALGFSMYNRDFVAHKANGPQSSHICHNSWNYTRKAFLEKKGRFIGVGHE